LLVSLFRRGDAPRGKLMSLSMPQIGQPPGLALSLSANAPLTVYYPFHGIYISLDYRFTTFGLHIPEGMTVQITDNKITVNGVGNSGPVQTTVHFSKAGQSATSTFIISLWARMKTGSTD
jgi:hypothetical protein